ncbi:glycosyltransferase family 4 protein [Nibrella viscosa]|uniref:Glycosyltransferase family 4 protein n=1 Tax=Nibrella viscosa TaxID=1084524 RepID=A0ABP8KLN7_9BACT
MKIVQLSTYHTTGGAAVAATRLHRALQRYGIDSSLLVGTSRRQEMPQPDPGVIRLANNFLADQMAFGRFVTERLFFLPYERDKSVRFQFSPAITGADLTFHPAIQQADIIHLHWINFGFLSVKGLGRLFRLGKPVVWTLHDMWMFTGGCHYSRGCDHYQTHCHHCPYLRRPGEHDLSFQVFDDKRQAYQDAPLTVVSPSRWLRDLAGSSPLGRAFQALTIPNPIDTDVFQPANRQAIRERLGLPTDRPLILFGSFNTADPRKGFQYFTEALRLLKDRLNAIQPEILIFGKGHAGNFVHLPFPVRHLGLLTTEAQTAAAYNAADVMVVPSLEDNLPNTVVESLACGTPIIGFQTGGIPEMIDHQQNGYLAAVGSAEELAEGMHWLLTTANPAALREQARQTAEKRFSEPVVAQQFLELYTSLLP